MYSNNFLTVSVGFPGWVARHIQTGCRSPPLGQSLETLTVSCCAPLPQSPTNSWHSLDNRKGSQGSLSCHWDYVVCNCNFEL